MAPKIVLTTERLSLVPYAAGFITPQHIGWLNNPDVVFYSEQRHQKHTEASQQAYLNSFSEGCYIWLIKAQDIGDIGTISAYVDMPNKVADMGILVGEPKSWNRGYGAEAWKRVMLWLRMEHKIRKIECGCMFDNIPMRKIATKCGMEVEGGRYQHFLLDGKPVDLLQYGKVYD